MGNEKIELTGEDIERLIKYDKDRAINEVIRLKRISNDRRIKVRERLEAERKMGIFVSYFGITTGDVMDRKKELRKNE